MTRSTTLAILAFFTLLIICLTVLTALGRDATQMLGTITAVIIPAVISLFGVNQASKAKEVAAEARDAAVTTTQQTNGRMTEMIQNHRDTVQELVQALQATGAAIPERYAEYAPDNGTEPRHAV